MVTIGHPEATRDLVFGCSLVAHQQLDCTLCLHFITADLDALDADSDGIETA